MTQLSVSSNALVLLKSACSKLAPLVPPNQQLLKTKFDRQKATRPITWVALRGRLGPQRRNDCSAATLATRPRLSVASLWFPFPQKSALRITKFTIENKRSYAEQYVWPEVIRQGIKWFMGASECRKARYIRELVDCDLMFARLGRNWQSSSGA